MNDTQKEEPTESDYAVLGKIADACNKIEFNLTQLYAGLSECNLSTALASFYVINGFHSKITVLESLAWQKLINTEPETQQKEEAFEAIKRALKSFKTLSEKRNKAIHGLWCTKENGELLRSYIGGTSETLYYQTLHKNSHKRAQSTQDRNEFTRKQLKDIIDQAVVVQSSFLEILNKHFPETTHTPPHKLPRWSKHYKEAETS